MSEGTVFPPSRLFDLVYHQRHALHKERLISDAEYGALVAQGCGAAARLETYDVLQARLTACEPTFAPDAEASETAHAAEEAAIAAAQSILRKAIAMNGQRPTERDRALLGSRNLTVRAFSRALFSHGFEPTFWFRTSGLAIEEASRP